MNGVFDMASRRHEAGKTGLQAWEQRTPTVQEMLGRRLKAQYEQIEQQPLPERLQDLLRRLDESDGHSSTG
jgi:hypothetical protein